MPTYCVQFSGENSISFVPHLPYSPDVAFCDFWLFIVLEDVGSRQLQLTWDTH